MTEGKKLSLSRIGQIAVTVHDLERAVGFYSDKLGMKHLFTVSHMAFFDCDGVTLMLSIPEKPEFDHPSSIIYFSVEDIQASYQALSDNGVRVDESPRLIAKMEGYDLWLASFRDSEENLLALMSKVPNEGAIKRAT